MSVEVVKKNGFYSDNPIYRGDKYLKYVKWDGTVIVPEMSDLYARVPRVELDNLKVEINNEIKNIKENSSLAQNKIDSLSSALTNKFEKLENLILSNERLEQEVQILRNVEQEIIEHIAREYAAGQKTIRKEIESFQQMDLQMERSFIESSIEELLQKIEKKIESKKLKDSKCEYVFVETGDDYGSFYKVSKCEHVLQELNSVYDNSFRFEEKVNCRINRLIKWQTLFFILVLFITIILHFIL